MRAFVCAAACALALATLACEGRSLEEGTAALWSADALAEANPFPDERTVDEGGGFRPPAGFPFRFMPNAAITSSADVTFAAWEGYVAEAGGWGVAASVGVRFSAPLDAAKLRPDAIAFVVVGPAPTDAEAADFGIPTVTRIGALARWIEDPGYLLVTPTRPLPAATRVIVGVRRDLDGGTLARNEAFVAHAAGSGRSDVEAAARALEVSPSEIALAFAYPTSAPADEMRRALELVRDVLPSSSFSAPVAPADLPDGLRGPANDLPDGVRVAVGTFTPLDLRTPDGIWGLDTPATPASLEVLYVLPDAALFPPPWSVVIAQHGFAGDRTFGLDVARAYVERGLAVLAIDASSHGLRGSFLGFLRVDDPRVARDHLRQTVLDVAQLATLVRRGGIDVDGTRGRDFDGTLTFYGHSMGTLVGVPLAQVDARFDAVALNAPGASFTTLFAEGVRLKAAVALLLRPALGLGIDDPAYDDALPFAAAVIQTLMEPADPLAYVEGRVPLTPPLLFQMNVGDGTLPNAGTRVLVDSLDIATLTAPVDGEPMDALWALDPAAFGFPTGDDPHGMHTFSPGIHIQTAEFLASGGRHLTDPLIE